MWVAGVESHLRTRSSFVHFFKPGKVAHVPARARTRLWLPFPQWIPQHWPRSRSRLCGWVWGFDIDIPPFGMMVDGQVWMAPSSQEVIRFRWISRFHTLLVENQFYGLAWAGQPGCDGLYCLGELFPLIKSAQSILKVPKMLLKSMNTMIYTQDQTCPKDRMVVLFGIL